MLNLKNIFLLLNSSNYKNIEFVLILININMQQIKLTHSYLIFEKKIIS